MFNISPRKLSDEYSGMSVEEIMEAEAAQGNAAAANFDKTILSDPIKLIELFQLNSPGNKYAILSNMNEKDLEDLLPLLSVVDLAMGLNFFTKDKLLKLMEEMPKEQLLKFTFAMFTPAQIMQLMPEAQLNKLLQSPEMDKDMELKYLKTIQPQVLAQMIESVTGQPVAGSQERGLDGQVSLNAQALLTQLQQLPDDKFQEAMINMPAFSKRAFIFKMTEQNPKLFQLFDSDAYTGIIAAKKDKPDLIKAATVLDPEQLVKMVQKLPQDLMATVLTQIDTNKFANILLKEFKDIIGQIVAG